MLNAPDVIIPFTSNVARVAEAVKQLQTERLLTYPRVRVSDGRQI